MSIDNRTVLVTSFYKVFIDHEIHVFYWKAKSSGD